MARAPRDHAAIYAARKARGLAAGKTLAEAVGKPNRDNHREYVQRIDREVKAGKRKPPVPRPSSGLSPRGVKLNGAKQFDGDDAAGDALKTINRLGSGSVVHLYVRVSLRGEPPHDMQLFPRGGIKAESLRKLIAEHGGDLAGLIRGMVVSGHAMADSSNPRVNPANRNEGSPDLVLDDGADELGVDDVEIERVVLQWTRT